MELEGTVAVMLWQIGCLAQTEAELVIRDGAPASCIAYSYVCVEVGKPCPLPGLVCLVLSLDQNSTVMHCI